MNDYIPGSCAKIRYTSIGDPSKLLSALGGVVSWPKTDIKSFHIIPIHPADYSLLCMKWDHMNYLARCLAMGLHSSCAIF